MWAETSLCNLDVTGKDRFKEIKTFLCSYILGSKEAGEIWGYKTVVERLPGMRQILALVWRTRLIPALNMQR